MFKYSKSSDCSYPQDDHVNKVTVPTLTMIEYSISSYQDGHVNKVTVPTLTMIKYSKSSDCAYTAYPQDDHVIKLTVLTLTMIMANTLV